MNIHLILPFIDRILKYYLITKQGFLEFHTEYMVFPLPLHRAYVTRNDMGTTSGYQTGSLTTGD
jgi:hypothetical protein